VLVRTWFGDDEAWEQLKIAIATPNEHGFLAYVLVVEDRSYVGLDPRTLAALTPEVTDGLDGAIVSFLADETTLTTAGWPILVVRVLPGEGKFPPFRVIASELWSVENNLNLANMDWRDFYRAADRNGVFRGF
jgi:hypothetical protein